MANMADGRRCRDAIVLKLCDVARVEAIGVCELFIGGADVKKQEERTSQKLSDTVLDLARLTEEETGVRTRVYLDDSLAAVPRDLVVHARNSVPRHGSCRSREVPTHASDQDRPMSRWTSSVPSYSAVAVLTALTVLLTLTLTLLRHHRSSHHAEHDGRS